MKSLRIVLLLLAVTLACSLSAQQIGEKLDEAGMDLSTPSGTMNLRLVDGSFKAFFIDGERKVVEAPYIRATLITEEMQMITRRDRIPLLKSGDGSHLGSPRNMKPPYAYWIRTILVKSDEDQDEDLIPRFLFNPATGD